MNCQRPPAGWRCTRGEGHQGPCAAVPEIVQGTSEWDAAVDAVMEKLHAPEEYAERIVRIVAEAIVAYRELP